jgi:hypothetical protein
VIEWHVATQEAGAVAVRADLRVVLAVAGESREVSRRGRREGV